MDAEIQRLNKQIELEPDDFVVARRLYQLQQRHVPEFCQLLEDVDKSVLIKGQFLVASKFPLLQKYSFGVVIHLCLLIEAESEFSKLKQAAFDVLGLLRGKSVIPALAQFTLAKYDSLTRAYAIHVLQKKKLTDRVFSVIQDCLMDECEKVQKASLNYCHSTLDRSRAFLSTILKLSDHKNLGIILNSLVGLISKAFDEKNSGAVVRSIEELISSDRFIQRTLGFELLHSLQHRLKQEVKVKPEQCTLQDILEFEGCSDNEVLVQQIVQRSLTPKELDFVLEFDAWDHEQRYNFWHLLVRLNESHWNQIPEQLWISELAESANDRPNSLALETLSGRMQISDRLVEILKRLPWGSIVNLFPNLLKAKSPQDHELNEIARQQFESYFTVCEDLQDMCLTFSHGMYVPSRFHLLSEGAFEATAPQHFVEFLKLNWPESEGFLTDWWERHPLSAFAATVELINGEYSVELDNMKRFVQFASRDVSYQPYGAEAVCRAIAKLPNRKQFESCLQQDLIQLLLRSDVLNYVNLLNDHYFDLQNLETELRDLFCEHETAIKNRLTAEAMLGQAYELSLERLISLLVKSTEIYPWLAKQLQPYLT